ncbi:MAG: hypothetical protein J6N54_05530, partial [Bacteroidales bacterium]|nr:hypothetical protein [Bacteroidales bacterium]
NVKTGGMNLASMPEDVVKGVVEEAAVAPAGYLGSFAPWITSRYDSCDCIKMLVDNNFRDFFGRAQKQYDTESLPVEVVGGFGYANRNILRRLAGPYGITFSKIIKAPVEGLVDFHSGRV